jgi:hypothetical protein
MTVVNNSAPRTHPNDKLRYIPKSGMSHDHTRTGSRRSRCLGGVAEVRPCETGCFEPGYKSRRNYDENNFNFLINHKQDYFRNSFFIRSANLWNSLSSELKSLVINSSISIFRARLHEFYNAKLPSYSPPGCI